MSQAKFKHEEDLAAFYADRLNKHGATPPKGIAHLIEIKNPDDHDAIAIPVKSTEQDEHN